jgi:hypothetical protein
VLFPFGKDEKLAKDQQKLPKLQASADRAKLRAGLNERQIHRHISTVDAETLGSQTLDSLTALAEKNHLVLTGFRTEKPVAVSIMREASFVAVLEGPYSDVMNLERVIEDPKSNLAPEMLQIAPTDTVSDRVIATLGLVAFLDKEKK